MDDPRSGMKPADVLSKYELVGWVHTGSAFHGISELVLGASETIEVQHEICKIWGSYQLMAVTFLPILQGMLRNRAVTVIMGIASSGVPGKGRDLKLEP